MSKSKVTDSLSESVSDKVTYWAVRWQLKRPIKGEPEEGRKSQTMIKSQQHRSAKQSHFKMFNSNGRLPLYWSWLFSSTVISWSIPAALCSIGSRNEDLVNLALSSPLPRSRIWPSPHWHAKERGSRERENCGPTAKISQFSGKSRVPGRRSTGCQLFGKGECHS